MSQGEREGGGEREEGWGWGGGFRDQGGMCLTIYIYLP